jgi:hypothetical protein
MKMPICWLDVSAREPEMMLHGSIMKYHDVNDFTAWIVWETLINQSQWQNVTPKGEHIGNL